MPRDTVGIFLFNQPASAFKMQKFETDTLISALTMPAILIGADERVLASNSGATSLLGPGVEGRHFITILRQPNLLDAVEETLHSGGQRDCTYLSTEAGRDTTWSAMVSAVDTGTTPRAALVTFHDITALQEANTMRRDFVSNVSHELRTPLTAILGFVETLRGPAQGDPKAQERFLGIINQEAGRMARLVDDLLSLSRVEVEERQRPKDPVALAPLITSALSGLEPLAAKSNVKLIFEDEGRGETIPGDSRQLGQVITNLVENAIKYGGPDQTVTITLGAAQPEPSLRTQAIRLSVADKGEGIPAHHIPRLTERFYRLDSHRSRELGGTGLGLAIVKHIISRHRGRLRITSTPGNGSTFTVILPTG